MDDLTRLHLIAQLERDEGRVRHVYRDSLGNLTIGIGFNLDANDLPDDVIDLLRDHKIRDTETELVAAMSWIVNLDEPRYCVLMNMGYNMGVPKLLGFTKMWGHLARGEYPEAVQEMCDSDWHREVGDRAVRLERIMLAGTW